MNNTFLDMIILYVKAIRYNNGVISCECEGKNTEIHNAEYLLNQTIRQIGIPKNRYRISEAAKKKWDEITNEPIDNYFYREKVICTNEGPVSVDLYRGNASKPYGTKDLKKGDSFIYREVFSNEHMIPVKMLINELLALEELNYKEVLRVLDLIYICCLLKKEEKDIKTKFRRSLNIEEVIKIDYKDINLVMTEDIDY